MAENLYWVARYIERAENTARLINVNANLLLDLPKTVAFGWNPLIEITGSEALFHELYDEANERNVIRFLTGDANNPGSILSSLQCARENIRTMRDFLPREAWEQLNELYLAARSQLSTALSKHKRYDYLRSIISGTQQMVGIFASTITHDHGYDFLRLGRYLERADMTTRIVDVRSADLIADHGDLTPFYNIQWMSVLRSMSAYQMYRREIQGKVRRVDVLRFLFQDRQFARSIYYCLFHAEACLRHLPRNEPPLRQLIQLQHVVIEADLQQLKQQDLHDFIDELQRELATIHDQIAATYFSMAAPDETTMEHTSVQQA
ncbi:MAG: alpha-E domain-containing protein [Acidiferrobacterales bacterium]|nr:alpha-E domain-containing protein [Acidiferrobacterales bacterium]